MAFSTITAQRYKKHCPAQALHCGGFPDKTIKTGVLLRMYVSRKSWNHCIAIENTSIALLWKVLIVKGYSIPSGVPRTSNVQPVARSV